MAAPSTQLLRQLAVSLRERDNALQLRGSAEEVRLRPHDGLVPGAVALWGPFAFPLAVVPTSDAAPGGRTAPHAAVAAASAFGRGRVVAIAHEALMGRGADVAGRNTDFIRRCVAWLGGADKLRILAPGGDVDAARRHIEAGGGCIVATCPWGWCSLHPGKGLDSHEFGLNDLLAQAGLAFTSQCVPMPDAGVSVRPTAQCQAALVSSMLSANLLPRAAVAQLATADLAVLADSSSTPLPPLAGVDVPASALQALPRVPDHLVGCHPSGRLDDARAAYGNGGWWAPACDHASLSFDFERQVEIAGVELWCVNVDASPRQVSVCASRDGRSWDVLATFAFATRNAGPGSTQNKPVRFQLQSTVRVRHARIQFNGIHSSHYIGVNDVTFLDASAQCPDVSATCTAGVLKCVPSAHRKLLTQGLLTALSGSDETPARGPTANRPVGRDSEEGRACIVMHSLASFGGDVRLPGAEVFPGRCTDSRREVDGCTVAVHGAGYRKGWWASTMLYANPGEPLVITSLPTAHPHGGYAYHRQWRLRVGCHTDDLVQHQDTWKRWPSVAEDFALPPPGSAAVTVTPAFGGLVYAECLEDQDPRTPPFSLRLAGGAARATFYTKDRGLVKGNAPWGEVEGEKVILTLPAAVIEDAERRGDLRAGIDFWDAVVRSHHRLATPPYGGRKERIVCDVQLSVGYMHSGYPIMVHMDFAERALDPVRLVSEGEWGAFHELGHNMQRHWWTWDGTVEVTVNLFTIYTMYHHLHRDLDKFDWWSPSMRAKIHAWVRAGRPYEQWAHDPGMALYMYAQLVHHFGYRALEAVMRAYETTPALQLPCDAAWQDKLRTWARVYSSVVGRDLTPFFHAWGFAFVPPVDGLPPWTCDVP
uniref:Peptidase M60 domain-containing protein n=1 Tax=Neobodo designis TaxID=312471 RepID=A0A7S1MBV2_NEODS